jgi:hypothetical protein
MKRFALLSVLALTACGGNEPPVVTAQPAAAPGGNWVVSEAFAIGPVASEKSPYLGQIVTLDAERAIDPAGRLCKAPMYSQNEGEPAAELGVQPEGKAGPRPIVTVTCDGNIFGTFVSYNGGWLTKSNSWVLTLAKEPAQPVAAVEPPPAPAPVPPPAAAPAPAPVVGMSAHDMHHATPAAKPAKDPRTLVYLASYKTEKGARDGFKLLAKASPILAKQQPVTQSVDLGKKGSWIRLYAMAADEAERATLCKQVGKRVDECGARNRE